MTADGGRLIDDAAARERLARVAIDTEVCELLGDRAAWVAVNGLPKTEGAEVKLFATEAYGRASSALVDMRGLEGLVGDHAGHSPGGIVEYSYRVAPIFTTAGGTSEIQKNLIAERGLGLPRSR